MDTTLKCEVSSVYLTKKQGSTPGQTLTDEFSHQLKQIKNRETHTTRKSYGEALGRLSLHPFSTTY